MSTFYMVIFAVGVLYTLVSLVISGAGGLHDLGGHAGAHLDGGLGHHHGGVDNVGTNHGMIHGTTADHGVLHGVHGQLDHGADSHLTEAGSAHSVLSWLGVLVNPMVMMSFLTVFGGLGLMGTRYLDLLAPLIFVGSMASGAAVSYTLYKFVLLPLYRSENTSNVSKENLLYEVAEVITPILENGFGEIRYTVNSIRYTAPARHHKNKAVKQGEKVVICRIENNIFYVAEFPELEGMDVDSFWIR